MSSATYAPESYAFMLPPGWAHIPLGASTAGTTAAIERLLDARFPGADGRSAPLRAAVRDQLETSAADARRAGGLDLYLLVDSPTEHPVDASLVVTGVPAGPEGAAPGLAELAPLLAEPGTEVTVVHLRLAGEALRLESRHAAVPGDPLGLAARQVQYVVGIPGTRNRLMLTFATTTLPVADALVGLFDAMAGTFGFTDQTRPPTFG